MRQGTYRQKCHDSDCKSFDGIDRPLPTDVTPWLTMIYQEWEYESNRTVRSMQETL